MNIFQKITGITNKKPLVDIFSLLILGIALIPKNLAISQIFEIKVYSYLMIAIVLVLGLGILIFARFAKKKQILNANTDNNLYNRKEPVNE